MIGYYLIIGNWLLIIFMLLLYHTAGSPHGEAVNRQGKNNVGIIFGMDVVGVWV